MKRFEDEGAPDDQNLGQVAVLKEAPGSFRSYRAEFIVAKSMSRGFLRFRRGLKNPDTLQP